MKKFVFTLQKPYEIKQNVYRQLIAGRERLKKQRDALLRRKEEMLRGMKEQGQCMSEGCRQGMRASQMSPYGEYIAGALRDMQKQEAQIEKLFAKMEENAGALLRVLNEIKVMEKIREEQLEQYNKELQKNDDKMLEDFLCGRI
jgi:flagellar export protein FliJ